MWNPGTAVLLDGTAQRLTATVGLVKAVRIMQHWSNTNRIYWGSLATLNDAVTPAVGVGGWLPPPTASTAPSDSVNENDAPNGINCQQIYVKGTVGEYVLWSYIEQ